MQRRRLTRAQKVLIFDAARGLCHICQTKIFVECGERWEVEHVKPLWLGGSDTFDNLAPAHIRCHRGKTGDEASNRAKSDRLRALHRGIKSVQWRPLPGTYASGIKRPLAGGAYWRDSGKPLWRR
jgi:5-methylcytosine-specific restriction endonuclease McrA